MSTVNVIMYLTCMDKFMYMQACLINLIIRYMHIMIEFVRHACMYSGTIKALS